MEIIFHSPYDIYTFNSTSGLITQPENYIAEQFSEKIRKFFFVESPLKIPPTTANGTKHDLRIQLANHPLSICRIRSTI